MSNYRDLAYRPDTGELQVAVFEAGQKMAEALEAQLCIACPPQTTCDNCAALSAWRALTKETTDG